MSYLCMCLAVSSKDISEITTIIPLNYLSIYQISVFKYIHAKQFSVVIDN